MKPTILLLAVLLCGCGNPQSNLTDKAREFQEAKEDPFREAGDHFKKQIENCSNRIDKDIQVLNHIATNVVNFNP